jgi:hypothetical protein
MLKRVFIKIKLRMNFVVVEVDESIDSMLPKVEIFSFSFTFNSLMQSES